MVRKFLFSWMVVGVVLMVQNQADAQTKPFKIKGEGSGPMGLPLPGQDPRPHWSIGTGTHLGVYYGEGEVQTNTAVFNPVNGHITGEFGSGAPFVFTGANGDKLVCFYGRVDHGASTPGTFELVPVPERGPGYYRAIWLADFVPVSAACTGKFAGVTGSWVMYAMSEPFLLGSTQPVAYNWLGDGRLTFKK